MLPFLLLAGIAGACSSSDDATPPPSDGGAPPEAGPSVDAGDAAGPTIDRATFASKRGQADCAYTARCRPGLTASGQTEAICRTAREKEIAAESLADAKFDQAAVDQAVACRNAASCDAIYGGKIEQTCPWPSPVNAGGEGAKCAIGSHCASSFCSGATSSACGTCGKSTRSAAGQACNETAGQLCENGAICAGGEAGLRCIKSVGLGDDCDSAGSATTGVARCGLGLLCTEGKCVKAGVLAAACQNVLDCDIYAGFACDTSGECAELTYGDAPDGCNMFGPNLCKNGFFCNAPAATGTGTSTTGNCKARVASGAACAHTVECPNGDECSGGTCKPDGSSLPVCN